MSFVDRYITRQLYESPWAFHYNLSLR